MQQRGTSQIQQNKTYKILQVHFPVCFSTVSVQVHSLSFSLILSHSLSFSLILSHSLSFSLILSHSLSFSLLINFNTHDSTKIRQRFTKKSHFSEKNFTQTNTNQHNILHQTTFAISTAPATTITTQANGYNNSTNTQSSQQQHE